jgi:hypothetical protein
MERPTGIYVSTQCNLAHRHEDGEPCSESHQSDGCWIHPMLLAVEEVYEVDDVYDVQEAFAKELEDDEWDDWDAIVTYLGEP